MLQSHIFDELSLQDQLELQRIFAGIDLPPLYSDVIAKSVFGADVHPDRLNFLLRSIAGDDSIDVRSSASNEGPRQSVHSKGMVTDLPSWLRDGRLSDLEIQKVAQSFIFTRVELYASDMLLLQYSVSAGQSKKAFSFRDVNEVLLVVLMVKSPETFREYDKICDRYIHRFTAMTADSGLSYPSRAKMIYVQLDKCLAQLKRGINAESKDSRPDRLQKWLAMIADTNDPDAASAAVDDETLARIRIEINNMAQDKEVQNMLMQEKFERMDWESYGEEREEQGRAEERVNTERERARADAEKSRADAAENRADAAENRADAAEEEVRKLRKLLEELKNKNT